MDSLCLVRALLYMRDLCHVYVISRSITSILTIPMNESLKGVLSEALCFPTPTVYTTLALIPLTMYLLGH